MGWVTVARKDFQDAIRSWLLLGLTAAFVVFAAGAAYLYIALGTVFAGGTDESLSTSALIVFLAELTEFFVPLIGLVVGYKSVVGERETGSIELLLSLPHTRRDVLVGKVLGRATVVSVSVVVGFLIAAGVVVVLAGSLAPGPYALFVVASLALALAFVATAVGFSAATRSSTLSIVGAGGLTLLFLVPFLWSAIPALLRGLLDSLTPLELDLSTQPAWAAFFVQLDPTAAYQKALRALVSLGGSGPPADAPVYLRNWFGFVVLAGWVVVPLVVGYLRFNSTDL